MTDEKKKRKRGPDTRPSASIRLAATHKQVSGYVPNADYSVIESAAQKAGVSPFAFMLAAAVRSAKRVVKQSPPQEDRTDG